MAYVQTPNEELQPQGAAQQTMPPPQTATGGPSAPATSSAGPSSPQGTASVPNASKTPPVNDLGAYLKANQPQAVQMGQDIANNLNQTAQQVTGDINAAQNDVNAQVQANTVAPNQDLVKQAAANPSEFVKNPQNLKDFLTQSNATYKGPTSWETMPQAQTLTTKVQNAVNTAPNINNTAGIQQLVTGQEKNPTVGMENLDTMLLANTPAAVEPIKAAIPKVQNLGQYLSGIGPQVNSAIQKAVTTTQAAPQLVRDTFLTGPNASVPAWEKALQDKLGTDAGQVNTYNKAIGELIAQENSANPRTASLNEAVKAYNDALQSDLNAPPNIAGANAIRASGATPLNLRSLTNPEYLAQPTLAEAATPEDVATQEALTQLLGTDFTPYFTPGNSSFKSPGAAPNLSDLLSPILSDIATQSAGANHNVWSYQDKPVTVSPKVDYVKNIEDAISSLKDSLGQSGAPTVPQANVPPAEIAKPPAANQITPPITTQPVKPPVSTPTQNAVGNSGNNSAKLLQLLGKGGMSKEAAKQSLASLSPQQLDELLRFL